MREVSIRLRFTRPCLGYAEKRTRNRNVMYVMPRDPSRRVMFLASWWRDRLSFAAKVLNRYQDLVMHITWDQVVDGRVGTYQRKIIRKRQDGSIKNTGYALHEAFQVGDDIGVNAVLPTNLSIEAFTELLTIVGRYKGISPYNSADDTFGTFDVVSVRPTIRTLVAEPVTV